MAITDKIRKLFKKIHGISTDELAELKYMFEHNGLQKGPPPEGCKWAFARMKYDDEIYQLRWCDVIDGWKDWLGSSICAEEILCHYPLDDILKEGENLE